MNSIIETSNVAQLIDIKSKPEKIPKLSAKLERYMVFGYWFLQQLKEQSVIDDTIIAAAQIQLKMYESLETKTEFFTSFETSSGATQKIVRKSIADFNKPVKAPKAPRASKKVANDDGGEIATQKKGRKKKTTEVVVDNNNDFINQLVAVANARQPEIVASIVEEPVAQVSTIENTSTSDENKAKKPRKKAVPKSKEQTVEHVVVDAAVETVVAATVETVVAATVETVVVATVEHVVVAATVEHVVAATVEDKEQSKEKKPRKKADPKPVSEPSPIVAELKTTDEVKSKKTTKKSTEPKANQIDAQAAAAAAKLAQEMARLAQEREIARQAAIKEAQSVVDDDDDDRSRHTVKIDEEDDQEEEEIHAREFVFNGKSYLIDENTDEVYDIETQDLIGKFDKVANKIIA